MPSSRQDSCGDGVGETALVSANDENVVVQPDDEWAACCCVDLEIVGGILERVDRDGKIGEVNFLGIRGEGGDRPRNSPRNVFWCPHQLLVRIDEPAR